MRQKIAKAADAPTEEKIIKAARKVFTQKGFAATRTRDIAAEAGINLALLNYYYRSKEKLFQLVMAEKLDQLFSVVVPIVNNHQLTLEEQLDYLIDNYMELLINNPELPLFVFNEIKLRPEGFKYKTSILDILNGSSLVLQLKQRRPDIEPVQIILSLLGMTIFPFIAKPILFTSDQHFKTGMAERKVLLKQWARNMLKK